jgi:hypothetical protein
MSRESVADEMAPIASDAASTGKPGSAILAPTVAALKVFRTIDLISAARSLMNIQARLGYFRWMP